MDCRSFSPYGKKRTSWIDRWRALEWLIEKK